ncbi:MAG: hypothetical protein LBC87_01910 [Fibromonadaceae bacterium]|jgi:hypothetical protein|nr:hypothetical protein [Fibromonadaceae bacterium]
MAKKTLSQKIVELVGEDPNSFDVFKEQQLYELLKPKNHEIGIDKVKWRPCRGNW